MCALSSGGKHTKLTKALSPFDDSVDKNPVVRSVVLKLLLKYRCAVTHIHTHTHTAYSVH